MTVLEQYVSEDDRLRPRTRREYLKAVRQFIRFAGRDPSSWTYASMVSWRRALTARGLKPQTVNMYLAGVKRASLNYARMNQNPQLDFASMVETLRADPPQHREPLTEYEARLLVAACNGNGLRDYRDRAIIILGLRTGCRRSGIISANVEGLRGRDLDIILKGGRPHTMRNLDDATLGALSNWLEVSNVRRGPIFRALSHAGTVTNRGLSAIAINKIVERRAQLAGLKHVHPHILRHTFISWCRRYNVPDWRIRQLTGQKSMGILDTYTTDQNPTPLGSILPDLE